MINYTNQDEFFLVFTEGDYWTSHLLKRGFEHVYVVFCDGFNWIMMSPMSNRLDVRVVSLGADAFYPRLIKKAHPRHTVLGVKVADNSRGYVFRKFGFISCVSVIKYMLGVRGFAFTPYQLFREIIKLKNKVNSCIVDANLIY